MNEIMERQTKRLVRKEVAAEVARLLAVDEIANATALEEAIHANVEARADAIVEAAQDESTNLEIVPADGVDVVSNDGMNYVALDDMLEFAAAIEVLVGEEKLVEGGHGQNDSIYIIVYIMMSYQALLWGHRHKPCKVAPVLIRNK